VQRNCFIPQSFASVFHHVESLLLFVLTLEKYQFSGIRVLFLSDY